MRTIISVCVAAFVAAGPALAGPEDEEPEERSEVTEDEIRSGAVVDDGLEIPHIRSGTQYFEIRGSTRIVRALGEDRLPTDDAGLSTSDVVEVPEPGPTASW